MRFSRRQFLYLSAGAATAGTSSLASFGAGAQTTRAIKIIVPYGPGGGTDIVARLLAEQIGRSQGLTIVIDNRPGAGTVIGTEAVSRAAPDGNTLLMTQPPFIINPHLRKQNYDPLEGFEPICELANSSTVIVVNRTSAYRSLADLLGAARARPGELTMAGNPASTSQIGFEILRRAANINMTFVPYAGAAPQATALLGGHVTAAFAASTAFSDHLKSGRLRALATLSRIEMLPDVPTFTELGLSELTADAWTGLLAPAKTPKETITQLGEWFVAAVHAPEVKTKLAVQQLSPAGVCGPAFAALLRKQYEDFGRVIREANIKAD